MSAPGTRRLFLPNGKTFDLEMPGGGVNLRTPQEACPVSCPSRAPMFIGGAVATGAAVFFVWILRKKWP